jgi:phosphosulfolactate synthase (CoM biosynthesis protein A)
MTELNEHLFEFLNRNERQKKPRAKGITEIRGPYYSVMGKYYLMDILETTGKYVDSLKFAGGSFSLIPPKSVKELINLAHEHDLLVSTGGFIEYVLTQGKQAVSKYLEACKVLEFDIIEISAGFITIPTDDWLKLIERVQGAGFRAKPEVGIQFGAGGDTPQEALQEEGIIDPEWAIGRARKFLEAGAYMIMIESEGITENIEPWRTEIPAKFINALGLEKLMFEAADPNVFAWYVQNYGPEVNLFIDHSQIVQLEALRQGIWGPRASGGAY